MSEEKVLNAEEVKARMKAMGKVRLIILAVMVVATICSFVFYDYIFGDKCVFDDRPFSSSFFNDILAALPRIIKCIQVVTIALVIVTVILIIVKHCFKKTRRSITVGSLICSLIRCVTAVVLVIMALKILFNVDTGALITGASVVTLVVGLGMQSLISDVVAGLFIIFENEFNIGDIITVEGFRGTVVSIGIRTTKLEAVGNIKIFNNSTIKQVLNQSLKPSVAICLIGVEYSEDLSRVESIVKENLPLIKIEGVLGDISYDGVNELAASAVVLRFSAECKEDDIFVVQRLMNRRIKDMFDANGISIPFNQIVVHNDK